MIRLWFRRLRHWLFWPIVTMFTVLFCVLFTIPGNQLIAWSANQVVTGLQIDIRDTRFFDNKPFSVKYQQQGVWVNASQIRLGIDWFCGGLCIENLSVHSLIVKLPEEKPTSEQTPALLTDPPALASNLAQSAPQTALIELPFNLNLSSLTVANFSLQQGQFKRVQAVKLAVKLHAEQSTVTLDYLRLKEVVYTDKSPKPDEEPPLLTELPAVTNIAFYSPLSVAANEVSVSSFRYENAQPVVAMTDIHLNAHLNKHTLSIETLSLHHPKGSLNLAGDAELVADNSLSLAMNIQVENNHLNMALKGPLHDLSVSIDNAGQYPFSIDVTADITQDNYPFSLQGQLHNWQLTMVEPVVSIGEASIAINGQANNYQLSLLADTQLNGFAKLSSVIAGKDSLTAFELTQANLKTPKSDVTLSGKADWQDGVSANIDLMLAQLDLSEVLAEYSSQLQGKASVKFTQRAEQWQLNVAQLALKGEVNAIPLEVAVKGTVDERLYTQLETLNVSSADNFLRVSGDVTDTWQLEGAISVRDPQQISADMTGIAKGEFSVNGLRATPFIDWQLGAEQFHALNVSIEHFHSVGRVDIANDFEATIDINATNVTLDQKHIRELALELKGNQYSQTGLFNLDSDWVSSGFTLRGQVQNQIWQGELAQLFVSDNVKRFAVEEPLSLSVNWPKQALNMAAHCWKSIYSTLCVDKLSADTQDGHVKLALKEFNLRSIDHLLPSEVTATGLFTGGLDLKWQQRKLALVNASLSSEEFDLTLRQEDQTFKLPFELTKITALADANSAQLNAQLMSTLLGTLNSELAISDLMGARTLLGHLSLTETKLSNFKPFLKQFDQLKGGVSADIDISGSLVKPILNGRASAQGIAVAGSQFPVSLKNSELEIAFNQQRADINAQLFDTNGGQAKLDGRIDWQAEHLAGHFNAKGEQLLIQPDSGIKLKLSPDMQIEFSERKFTVAGEVVVPYGRIELKSLPKGAVKVSDDEVIVDAKIKTKKPLPFDYIMNLDLIVRNDVRVDSFGLNSKVEGHINLKKNQSSPLLAVGDMNLVSGKYLALSQDLQIQTGQIGFNGAIDKPYLNIKAIRNPDTTADGVIAGVKLTGPVETPELEIFSEPSMDQAMSLSYLLNGRPLGDGDTSNDGLLTQLLITQGLSRSEGVVSRFGEAIGIEDISVGSTGSGDDTKVEISGYVLPGVQVRYSIGIFDPITEIAVRYQVLPQLYIEATNGVNNALDILYKFDWD